MVFSVFRVFCGYLKCLVLNIVQFVFLNLFSQGYFIEDAVIDKEFSKRQVVVFLPAEDHKPFIGVEKSQSDGGFSERLFQVFALQDFQNVLVGKIIQFAGNLAEFGSGMVLPHDGVYKGLPGNDLVIE